MHVIYQIENVFRVSIGVKFERKRNAVETLAASTAISISSKLSRVLLLITLWKHRENIFYCIYEIKARSNFLCFYRVMVNGFEPIRARVVVYLIKNASSMKTRLLYPLRIVQPRLIMCCSYCFTDIV